MRFVIISSGIGWHVQDLRRAALQLGHNAEAVDFRRLGAEVGTGAETLADAECVIVRTMPPGSLEQVVFRMDLLHRLQARGVPVFNPPAALETCIDKYLATARLEAAGLLVPPTIVCQQAEAALAAFAQLGGDVVVKPLFGSEGRGMVRVTDYELAWRTFRAIERTAGVLYLQQFIPHEGYDLRAFVLGDRILTSMRRCARGDWRTNVAQGGKAEFINLSPDQQRLALAAARAVKTPICGVDLLPGKDGKLYVLEVNAVPGWRALAPATGVDVAAELIRYVSEGANRRSAAGTPRSGRCDSAV
jgi:ribosomal protein S6--L-glutamate ligase